jgi:hypothetical protein
LEEESVDALGDKLEELNENKTVPEQKIFKNKTIDVIEKKRSMKRWKKSTGYYSLKPNRFTFGLKDL